MLTRIFVLMLMAMPLIAQSIGQPRVGSLAQIAVGYFDIPGSARGTWTTSMVFLNVSAEAATVQVKFYSSAGQPLILPVTGVGPVSQHQFIVPFNGTVWVDFDESAIPLGVGWAEVTTSASVRGQGIYRTRIPGKPVSEAAVPLLVREPSVCIVPIPGSAASFPEALILPFDNTKGYVSSMAFANTTAAAATIEIEFLDEAGTLLHTIQPQLTGRGHFAFETTDYAAVIGKKGQVRVKKNPEKFTGIAFLFSPDGPFTTLLPISR
jgi:hypothetical protein